MTAMPDARGRFGAFGGRFVPETLMDALDQLAAGLRGGQRRPRVPGRVRPALAATTSAGPRRSTSPSG